ncbi:MAG: hypothetical protein A4E37_01338 [Methanoregulaceae archaeon PtaB.Bin056]|nr:MAG: hypothetical protein A4E37_01338 [Methanoregulaceae archaeon PtaB.Bin056]
MPAKKEIIGELGEEGLILPTLVNNALAANDRIKYFFTLLQAAQARAENPHADFSGLRVEREAAGIETSIYDRVVAESESAGEGVVRIPYASRLLGEVRENMREMATPLLARDDADAAGFRQRLEALEGTIPAGEGDLVERAAIEAITAGQRGEGDSIHLLVMDMHRALNRLQGDLASEVIDGAMAYLLGDGDRDLVRAFMSGVNRTAPLKFDHPGLGTTATRNGQKLLLQNDIGMTDAHVLVITIEGRTVTITYTDIHMPRLQFFQGLFEGRGVKWADTLSKKGAAGFEKKIYHLSTGTYAAKGDDDLAGFLAFAGSRLVFLIDWNRARKRLRNFLLTKDAVAVLKWAADNEFGHMGFLLLGGEKMIYDAMEMSSRVPMRYGEPLHQILGRERSIEYFQWVLRVSATGLLAHKSRLLIQDEIKAELLRYFRSAHEGLMEICEEHATLTISVATVVREALQRIQMGGDVSFIARSAQRAKKWESEADLAVTKVRTLSRRIENAEFYPALIFTADDALDFLEEASFFVTLIPSVTFSRKINQSLVEMAELAERSAQEFLKALIASQYVYKGYSRDDMQEFLQAIDHVLSLEHQSDEALRLAQKTILVESRDWKEMQVYGDLARTIEESTNSMMKAAFLLRDDIMERMNR